jgi:hypothetical protein
MISPSNAWVFARLVSGQSLNGQVATLPEAFKRMGEHLEKLPLNARPAAWHAMIQARPDGNELVMAVADVDPLGPRPETPPRQYATAADVGQGLSGGPWIWDGWIPPDRIVGIAAGEGIGKTRFMLDLCRRVWLGMPWPDGQSMALAAGTPTLWLCADGQHDELAETLPALGVPPEAIVFPAEPSEPYDHVSLDSPETLEWVKDAIVDRQPWCFVVDSLTYATTDNLCEQRAIARLKLPLVALAQSYHINVVALMHVSKDGQALGRRIRGITRTLMHLKCPDPEQPQRLKLWVEKSYGKKPPALGVTMTDSGNEYDSDPPGDVEPNKGGRPRDKRKKAAKFIRDALTRENDQIGNDLCELWEKDGESERTFWRAVDELRDAGELVTDGGPGTGQQIRLHLLDAAGDEAA